MEKEKYIQFLKELEDMDRKAKKVYDAMREFDSDFGSFSTGYYEPLAVDIIETAMGDKTGWTSYWVYELEFGRKAKKNSVKDKNDKPLKCKTAGDIYELITKK